MLIGLHSPGHTEYYLFNCKVGKTVLLQDNTPLRGFGVVPAAERVNIQIVAARMYDVLRGKNG
jgi:hypothetical protein